MPVTEFLAWVLQGFWRTLGLILLVSAAATWRPVSVRMVQPKGSDDD